MPDNYSVAVETGGYRLLELFAERCGDDAAVTITDGDGHQIASHAMPVAERMVLAGTICTGAMR